MQFSTNRLTSVAHYNYVKFLSKNRTARKRVQDIVTILGLHSDDPAPFSPKNNVNFYYVYEKWTKKNSALVLYVTKTLIYKDTILSRLTFKMNVYSEYFIMKIKCDLRTRTMTFLFYPERGKFWIINLTNVVSIYKKHSFSNSKFM